MALFSNSDKKPERYSSIEDTKKAIQRDVIYSIICISLFVAFMVGLFSYR